MCASSTAPSRTAAAQRRVGFAIRYIPTSISQVGPRTTASLVRGVRFHHFDDEPVPAAEFDPAAVAFHANSLDRVKSILYAGAAKNRPG